MCGSLKRKTHDNPSGSGVVEYSASADEVPSLKKSHKYCPSESAACGRKQQLLSKRTQNSYIH
jgi:hypothetical protein